MTEETTAILAAIAGLTTRIDNLEANMNARFDRLEARMDRLEARMDRLEAAVLEIGDKLLTGYEMTKVREKLTH